MRLRVRAIDEVFALADKKRFGNRWIVCQIADVLLGTRHTEAFCSDGVIDGRRIARKGIEEAVSLRAGRLDYSW